MSTKAELEAKVTALEAQLVLARTMYRALRDGAPVAAHIPRPVAVEKVTQWTDRSGQLWETRQLGTRRISRKVEAA